MRNIKMKFIPQACIPPSDHQWAGLPEWTKADRNIKDKDLVVWYVMGKSHIVRPRRLADYESRFYVFQANALGIFESNPVWGKPPVHKKILESMKEEKSSVAEN